MDVTQLERWLRRKLLRDAQFSLALSPAALLGALLVLFLTFWFSYAVIYAVAKVFLAIPSLLFDTRWKLGHAGRLWITSTFMVLLIVSYLRSDRSGIDWSNWDQNPSLLGETLARFGARSGRAGLLLAYPEMSARIIVDLLNTGPRLLFGAMGFLRQGARAWRADSAAGARLLWTLASQPGLVTYEALKSVYDGRELVRAFHAISLVEGIVFLERGVTLTAERREELRRFAVEAST